MRTSKIRSMASRIQPFGPFLTWLTRPISHASRQTITRLPATTTSISRWLPTAPARAYATVMAKGKGAPNAAKPAKKLSKKKRAALGSKRDPRYVQMIKTLSLNSQRKTPAPLRMGRNRFLRHWTIHRAWLLYRRKENERRTRELMRQWQSMAAACEELRTTSGPGEKGEGYLYRVAMEKVGVYGLQGIPIEYARPLTETPARIAWNHGWKRSS
jgi:large subunit ribosomal protein L40